MPRDTSVELTLSIWRDFVPPRPLAFTHDEEAKQVFTADSILQEQIYSWPLREDVLAGISDEETRQGLHQRLVEQFSDSRPPSERCLDALREFVNIAQAAIDAGQASPTQSQSRTNEDFEPDEGNLIKVNTLLALIVHLKWIIACFDKRPGISVSVR